ncbi:hypothetical protein D3C71_1484250 [compost metagenome]
MLDVQQIMPERDNPFFFQRYPQQIGERRHNIRLSARPFDHLALRGAGHMNNERDIEPADAGIVGNAQGLLHLLRRNILRLKAEMIPVKYQHGMIPQPAALQAVNQGSDGIIRVIDCGQIVTEHRVLKVVRHRYFAEGLRYFKRVMAGGGDELGVERRTLLTQLGELLDPGLVQLLIRGAE